MKKHLLSATAIALAISAGSAFAADLPSRKGPPVYIPPPPMILWTGFYAGLNAGYTWSESNSIQTTAGGLFFAPTWNTELAASTALASGNNPAQNSGFIGGGQIGYNWQFANSFVAGVEADIQGIASSHSNSARSGALVPVGFPAELIVSNVSASRSIDYLGTVRGRLGYLVTPAFLAYATGGLAYGGVNASTSIFQANLPFNPPFASVGAFSDTRVGWTVGGGLEWMFLPNWSAKVEYLYYDLGNVTYNGNPFGLAIGGGALQYLSVPQSTTRFNGHVVRAGVNYHFNWGAAPVYAKY